MATIVLSLSAKTDKVTSQHEVLIRFFHGRINQRAKTNVFVKTDYWDEETHRIKLDEVEAQLKESEGWRKMTPERKRRKQELEALRKDLQGKTDRLNVITSLVSSEFEKTDKKNIAQGWLKSLIDGFNFPKNSVKEQGFFEVLTKYINERDFSLQRKRHFQVVWRTLKRFELYKDTCLSFDTITDDTLRTFEAFFRDEHIICERDSYRKILEAVPESRQPQPRGKNATNNFMRHFRTFWYWAMDFGFTANNPFRKYKIVECLYGTPYYITIDERNTLYNFDFSDQPSLARQRDIFVFQCLIGCRVSDLWAMTKNNIVDGAIEQ